MGATDFWDVVAQRADIATLRVGDVVTHEKHCGGRVSMQLCVVTERDEVTRQLSIRAATSDEVDAFVGEPVGVLVTEF